jgi:hypothetical protein
MLLESIVHESSVKLIRNIAVNNLSINVELLQVLYNNNITAIVLLFHPKTLPNKH